MAYYFYYGHHNPVAPLPYYLPQNQSLLQSCNYENHNFPVENISCDLGAPSQSSSSLNKSPQEYATIIPEEINQNADEAVRNRRKRERNMERELVSAKKNSESNIINHFFTYFILKDCSESMVKRVINSLKKSTKDTEKMVTIFYNVIRLINLKRGRKYINKAILCSYFTEEWLVESIENIENLEEISVSEIALLFRKCLHIFINEISLCSILTSKRITKHSKEIHLAKRRKIMSFMDCKGEND